ncbi:MAG: RDD family protein, partial [Candidatus Hodarchaeales archaeon]
ILEEFRTDALFAMKDSDKNDPYEVFGSPRDVAKDLSQGHDWGTQRASWMSRTLAFIIDVTLQFTFLLFYFSISIILILAIFFPVGDVFHWFDSGNWYKTNWIRTEWVTTAFGTDLPIDQGFLLLIILIFFFGSVLLYIVSYGVVLERIYSKTIGKKLMGLMVVDKSGIRITWTQAIIRNLSKIFDVLFLDVVLGMILEKQNPEKTQKQKGMDVLAETIVIKL